MTRSSDIDGATTAEARVRELIAHPTQTDSDELARLFAALEPVGIEFMTGRWRGGALPSGHPSERGLVEARWHGKHFVSAQDVKPLICVAEDGTLFSNVERGQGEASLWMIEFEGVLTASMVYDGRPVIDHFKRIDDETVMGVMNGKGPDLAPPRFHFYLERER